MTFEAGIRIASSPTTGSTPGTQPVYGPPTGVTPTTGTPDGADRAQAAAARRAQERAVAEAAAAALRRQIEAQQEALEKAQREAYRKELEAQEAKYRAEHARGAKRAQAQRKADEARRQADIAWAKADKAQADLDKSKAGLKVQQSKIKDADAGRSSSNPSVGTVKAQRDYDLADKKVAWKSKVVTALEKGDKADGAEGGKDPNAGQYRNDADIAKAQAQDAYADYLVGAAQQELDDAGPKEKPKAQAKLAEAQDFNAWTEKNLKAVQADAAADKAERDDAAKGIKSPRTADLRRQANQAKADADNAALQGQVHQDDRTYRAAQSRTLEVGNQLTHARTELDAAKTRGDKAAVKLWQAKVDALTIQFAKAKSDEDAAKKLYDQDQAALDIGVTGLNYDRALSDWQAEWARQRGLLGNPSASNGGTDRNPDYDPTVDIAPIDANHVEGSNGRYSITYSVKSTLGGSRTYTVTVEHKDGQWYAVKDGNRVKINAPTARLWDAWEPREGAKARQKRIPPPASTQGVPQSNAGGIDTGAWLAHDADIGADVTSTQATLDQKKAALDAAIDKWRRDHHATDPNSPNYNGWQTDPALQGLRDDLAIAVENNDLARANADALAKVKMLVEAEYQLYMAEHSTTQCFSEQALQELRDKVKQARQDATAATKKADELAGRNRTIQTQGRAARADLPQAQTGLNTAKTNLDKARAAAAADPTNAAKRQAVETAQRLYTLAQKRVNADQKAVAWVQAEHSSALSGYYYAHRVGAANPAGGAANASDTHNPYNSMPATATEYIGGAGYYGPYGYYGGPTSIQYDLPATTNMDAQTAAATARQDMDKAAQDYKQYGQDIGMIDTAAKDKPGVDRQVGTATVKRDTAQTKFDQIPVGDTAARAAAAAELSQAQAELDIALKHQQAINATLAWAAAAPGTEQSTDLRDQAYAAASDWKATRAKYDTDSAQREYDRAKSKHDAWVQAHPGADETQSDTYVRLLAASSKLTQAKGGQVTAATTAAQQQQQAFISQHLKPGQESDAHSLYELFKQNPKLMAQALINQAYLDTGGVAAQMANDTQLRNAIGLALGLRPTVEIDTSDPQAMVTTMRTTDVFAGASDDERKTIATIADHIKEKGGDKPTLTVVPIVYGNKDQGIVKSVLFRVESTDGNTYYIDQQGAWGKGKDNHAAIEDWRYNNRLSPDDVLVMPENGEFQIGDDGNVRLWTGAAREESIWDQARPWVDGVLGVTGIVAGVVVTVGSAGILSPAGAIMIGSGVAVLADGGAHLYNMSQHGYSLNPLEDGEAASTEVGMLGAALGTVAGGASMGVKALETAVGQSGRGFAVVRGASAGLKVTSETTGLGAMGVGVYGTGSGIYDLHANWDRLSATDRWQSGANIGLNVAGFLAGGAAAKWARSSSRPASLPDTAGSGSTTDSMAAKGAPDPILTAAVGSEDGAAGSDGAASRGGPQLPIEPEGTGVGVQPDDPAGAAPSSPRTTGAGRAGIEPDGSAPSSAGGDTGPMPGAAPQEAPVPPAPVESPRAVPPNTVASSSGTDFVTTTAEHVTAEAASRTADVAAGRDEGGTLGSRRDRGTTRRGNAGTSAANRDAASSPRRAPQLLVRERPLPQPIKQAAPASSGAQGRAPSLTVTEAKQLWQNTRDIEMDSSGFWGVPTLSRKANALIRRSPTMQAILGELAQKGWRVTTRNSSGTYAWDILGTGSDGLVVLDRGLLSNPVETVGALAHESGHTITSASALKSVPAAIADEGLAETVRLNVLDELGLATTTRDRTALAQLNMLRGLPEEQSNLALGALQTTGANTVTSNSGQRYLDYYVDSIHGNQASFGGWFNDRTPSANPPSGHQGAGPNQPPVSPMAGTAGPTGPRSSSAESKRGYGLTFGNSTHPPVRGLNPTRSMSNCVAAALTADRMLAGGGAHAALPVGGLRWSGVLTDIYGRNWQKFGQSPQTRPVTAQTVAAAVTKSTQPGARGIIWVVGSENNRAHAFNWEHTNDGPVFFDAQASGKYVTDFWADEAWVLVTHDGNPANPRNVNPNSPEALARAALSDAKRNPPRNPNQIDPLVASQVAAMRQARLEAAHTELARLSVLPPTERSPRDLATAQQEARRAKAEIDAPITAQSVVELRSAGLDIARTLSGAAGAKPREMGPTASGASGRAVADVAEDSGGGDAAGSEAGGPAETGSESSDIPPVPSIRVTTSRTTGANSDPASIPSAPVMDFAPSSTPSGAVAQAARNSPDAVPRGEGEDSGAGSSGADSSFPAGGHADALRAGATPASATPTRTPGFPMPARARATGVTGKPLLPETVGGASDRRIADLRSWREAARVADQLVTDADALRPSLREQAILARLTAEPLHGANTQFTVGDAGSSPVTVMYGTGFRPDAAATYGTFAEARSAAAQAGGRWLYRLEDMDNPSTFVPEQVMGAVHVDANGVVLPVGLPNMGATAWLNRLGRVTRAVLGDEPIGAKRVVATTLAARLVAGGFSGFHGLEGLKGIGADPLIGDLTTLGGDGEIVPASMRDMAGTARVGGPLSSTIGFERGGLSRLAWFVNNRGGSRKALYQAGLGTPQSKEASLSRVARSLTNTRAKGIRPMAPPAADKFLANFETIADRAAELRETLGRLDGAPTMEETFSSWKIRPTDGTDFVPEVWKTSLDKRKLEGVIAEIHGDHPDVFRDWLDTRGARDTLLASLDRMDSAALEATKQSGAATPEGRLLEAFPDLFQKFQGTVSERLAIKSAHEELVGAYAQLIGDGLKATKVENKMGGTNDPLTPVGRFMRKSAMGLSTLSGINWSLNKMYADSSLAGVPVAGMADGVLFFSAAAVAKYSNALDARASFVSEHAPDQIAANPALAAEKARLDAAVEKGKEWQNAASLISAVRSGGAAANYFAAGLPLMGDLSLVQFGTTAAWVVARWPTMPAKVVSKGVRLATLNKYRPDPEEITPKFLMNLSEGTKTKMMVSAVAGMIGVPAITYAMKYIPGLNSDYKDRKNGRKQVDGVVPWVWNHTGGLLFGGSKNNPASTPSDVAPSTTVVRPTPSTTRPNDGEQPPKGGGPRPSPKPQAPDLTVVVDDRSYATRTLFGMAQEGLTEGRLLTASEIVAAKSGRDGGVGGEHGVENAALRKLYQINPRFNPALEDGHVTSDPTDPDRLVDGQRVNLGPKVRAYG
jgi:hypothetical protein